MTITDIRLLQVNLAAWSDATFGPPEWQPGGRLPESNGPERALRHLHKEVDEALAAPSDLTEYADCLLLLLDAVRRAGYGADELVDAGWRKFRVCKQRSYTVRGDDGVSEHDRTAE